MSKNSPYEDLRSLGEFLRDRVPAAISTDVAARAVSRRRPRGSRTWIAVVVTGALLALSNVALARASDPAIPGEFLYPLDRAYEWIGARFGSQDLGPERISEAMELVEAGDTDRALSLVNEILAGGAGDTSLSESVDALRGSGNSQDLRDQVRDLVAAAAQVHVAAQSGNHDALGAAIAKVKEAAADIAETAGNGQPAGSSTESPSVTAPGQVDDPPADSPSDTAPGQVDDPPADSPSDTAPGQSKKADKNEGSGDGGNNSGQGGGQGSSNP